MTSTVSLDSFNAVPPAYILNFLQEDKLPKKRKRWVIVNEIKPSDLYCYLYARFGCPNGLQNFLRGDTSDNLIHWDWTLSHDNGLLVINGLNTRTEIYLIGEWDSAAWNKQQFVLDIKKDFSNYGKKMSDFKTKSLEDWDILINPYRLLKDAITQLKNDLDDLALNPIEDKLDIPVSVFMNTETNLDDIKQLENQWADIISKYNRGIGLAMALRIMTPILAESFVNLVLFILCRPDIKKNERLYTSTVRANIDIRVQSLHINCQGFEKSVDWKAIECSKYNSIVNERNDILHGNIAIEKLKLSEIYFLGKVPVFKKYEDFWQQSIGASINASGLSKVTNDLMVVNEFINYILSCLNPKTKEHVEIFINRRDIGINKKNSCHIGALLPNHIVDCASPMPE